MLGAGTVGMALAKVHMEPEAKTQSTTASTGDAKESFRTIRLFPCSVT